MECGTPAKKIHHIVFNTKSHLNNFQKGKNSTTLGKKVQFCDGFPTLFHPYGAIICIVFANIHNSASLTLAGEK